MERLSLLVCLSLICLASADLPLGPRGARPVELGTRDEKCATKTEWPLCLSEEWGPKCPSGCRIDGLMNKYDHAMNKKIVKIRSFLEQNSAKQQSADQLSKQTHSYVRDRLIVDSSHDNNYYNLAQDLQQKISDMKIKIDRQMMALATLKDQVKDQVEKMQRLEVDIDIKLRSCKGSCKGYTEYQVDKESYVVLDKQIKQLDTYSAQYIEPARTLYVMKSKSFSAGLQDLSIRDQKSKGTTTVAAQQTEDMFPGVLTKLLIIEEEGSLSSPATITKVTGTSNSPHTSTSSSSGSTSSSSSSSTSITELGGLDHGLFDGDAAFAGLSKASGSLVTTEHTSAVSCTRSVRTVIEDTKNGPVERTEEVIEGGPNCHALTESTKGHLSSAFPTLTHASSSHTSSSHTSSSHTSSSHTGGTKGSFSTDANIDFEDPFGSDFGAFRRGTAEDDAPDVQARSAKSKSGRVERQADYIGKDCVEAYKNHLNGETNGLFKIKPGGMDSTEVVEVYCQQEGLMGGWLLVQQRESGVVSFNRTWAEYRTGFGTLDAIGKGEFWLGNQNLHLLTNHGETLLKVELEDWEGGVASADYTIRVGSEEEGYPLHVSGYIGEAGDALVMPKSDMASYLSHNGMKFSTFDKDNDKWEENCAEMYGGGWWYNNCQSANLNGIYYKGTYDPEKNTPYEIENGVVWVTYKPANYSLKTVRMLIRSSTF